MQLSPGRPESSSLAGWGREAVALLRARKYHELANLLGYARAFDRQPPLAIEEDLEISLREVGAARLSDDAVADPAPTVKRFAPNDSGLLAVVEAIAITDNGERVLVELVVGGTEAEPHLCLEDISGVV